MNAEHETRVARKGGKSRKNSVHKTQPNRANRARPLAPKEFVDIIEHMNDGVVVLDKDWRYVYVNQKAAIMLQRQQPSDLIGKHIWTEYPEGVGQPFQKAYEKAMREQISVVFEDHYEPWDLWFENRIYPSPDTLMILFTEITERKRMERLLEERQHVLQKILDTEPGTVYIYDLEERRNVYVNRHWLSAFGYTPEETQAMGDDLSMHLFHQDDLARISAHHESWRQAGEGEIREIEFRVHTKTGEWRWVHSREVPFARDERGRVKQILGITQDITEQKKAEEEVHEQNRFISALAETTPGLVYIYDWQTDSNVYSNTGFEFLLGYTSEDVKNMGTKLFAQLLHPEDGAAVVASQQRLATAGDNDMLEIDYRMRHANGEWRWLRSYERPFARNTDGSLKQKIGIAIDFTERKRAEEALRESEEKFSKVFYASPIPLNINRLSDGRYVEVNESFLKRLGYQRDEVLGKTVSEIGVALHPEDIEKILHDLREQGSLRNYEVQFRTKSGEIGTSLLFREVVEIAGEKHFIGMNLDITERKRTEEALRESEARYRAVVENQTEFIVRWKPDGTRTFVNEAYCHYFGVSPQQALATGFMPLVVDEDQAAVQAKISRLISGNVRSEMDIHRVVRPDGSIGWQEWVDQPIYDETGQIVEFQSVGRDITERKQTEEALAASEAELRALFASMNDVVLVIDREGVYRKIAPTNPNLLYKPPEELLGKSLRDVFPAERAESFINTVRQVIETQQTAHIEYELVIGEQAIWFDAAISPMEENSTLWIARDITDRKRAEERLRQLNEELEQRVATRTEELAAAMVKAQESDRLKSAFLATMSHELRTPLNSIIGFTGVILQGLAGPLNEEQTKQLNMTYASARHLLALINDVLDISRIEAGQLEIVKRPFDMRQAIESALRVVQPLLQKKDLLLRTSIGSSVGSINQDRRRVEQVLINLANNAIKFTERGEVNIECQIRNGWLETCVRDTGIGIRPEDIQKLFKPFQQIETGLARSHEGTGLGLSICKHLVSAMGGEITVESQWGVGSTFTFTLPM